MDKKQTKIHLTPNLLRDALSVDVTNPGAEGVMPTKQQSRSA
jgi:hypothetical protein